MKGFKKSVLMVFISLQFVLCLNSLGATLKEKFNCTKLITFKWGIQEGTVGLLKGPDRFYGPRSLEIDETTGRILILDSENERVSIFDNNGNHIHSFAIDEHADELLLTKKQTLFILNCSTKTIKEFNLKGQVISHYIFSDVTEPITGINLIDSHPALETADGKTIKYDDSHKEIQNKTYQSATSMKRIITGRIRGNKTFIVERQFPQRGILKLYNDETQLEKEIPILPHEGNNIETINLLGIDNLNNIYLVVEESINPGFKIKRLLKKMSPNGELLAESVIPYSCYAYIFKDLKLTASGKVYQMLPLEKGLEVLEWSPISISIENENYEDLIFFSGSLITDKENNQEAISLLRLIDVDSYSLAEAAITPDNILYRAQQYANLTFNVNSSNITPLGGVSCGGKTVETNIRTSGTYTGVPYKWGGFSGIIGVTSYTDCGYNFSQGLNAGLYAGDKNCDTSFGSCCAVGVDCSGFVSQCWGLSTKYSTSTLPPVSYLLYSYDFLEQGDALNNLSSHVMLFFRRETDGRFTVYESSALDWKVSLRSYYAYQISGYSPYRYWQYSASNKFSVGTRVQVATTENLPVRNSYTRSATQLYSVTYPATGTIVEGPIENEGFLWVRVQWDGQSTPGWCNSAPLAKVQTSTVTITVATVPTSLQVTVDGANYTTPVSFQWTPGSQHSVSTSSPQSGPSGTRYVFSSWSDGGAQSHTITTPSTNTTYTANFTTQYSLTTSANPTNGGTVSPSGTNWYNSGQTVSVQATPNTGYKFSSWSGDASGSNNPISITMNTPKNIVANFNTSTAVTISFASSPSGLQVTVDGANYTTPVSFQWTPGSQHSVSTSSPQSGPSGTRYVFSSWSDGGAQSHTITTPSTNTTYTANFTTQYSLTTSANPTNGGTVSPSGTNWYNSGQTVSVQATPNTGYKFSSWSGDASGSNNPISITMNTPKNIVANFNIVSPLILALSGQRLEGRAWIIKVEYANLSLTVSKSGPIDVNRYTLIRKVANQSYVSIKEFSDSELKNNSWTFNDINLNRSVTYSYLVEARAADGSVIARSNELTLPSNKTVTTLGTSSKERTKR